MTLSSAGLTRVCILLSGVLGVILPQLSTFGLPTSTANTISAIGGVLLAVLAWLEHPTTKASATSTPAPGTVPASQPLA